MEALEPVLAAALRQDQGRSFTSCFVFFIILQRASVAVEHRKPWSSICQEPLVA